MKTLKSLWIQFQMLRGFFYVVRHPERTDVIIEGINLIQKMPDQTVVNTLLDEVYAHREMQACWDEQYLPGKPDLAKLRELPAGSFGRAVADHLDSNGINYDVFPDDLPTNRLEYLNYRMFLEHDFWHVLLSANTSVPDELALQAFNVAQLRTPFGALLIAGGLLHLLRKDPILAADTVGKVSSGYQLGKNAKLLLGLRLSEHFARPLEEVRQMCGVAPLSGNLGGASFERKPVALAMN